MNERERYEFERDVLIFRENALKQREQKGNEELIKYFDRLHDKLFAVNNIFIGGYLALIAFKKDVPSNILWVPMVNLAVLVSIDYLMMRKSKQEALYRHSTIETDGKLVRLIRKANFLSLASIVSTIIETLLFVKYVS